MLSAACPLYQLSNPHRERHANTPSIVRTVSVDDVSMTKLCELYATRHDDTRTNKMRTALDALATYPSTTPLSMVLSVQCRWPAQFTRPLHLTIQRQLRRDITHSYNRHYTFDVILYQPAARALLQPRNSRLKNDNGTFSTKNGTRESQRTRV